MSAREGKRGFLLFTSDAVGERRATITLFPMKSMNVYFIWMLIFMFEARAWHLVGCLFTCSALWTLQYAKDTIWCTNSLSIFRWEKTIDSSISIRSVRRMFCVLKNFPVFYFDDTVSYADVIHSISDKWISWLDSHVPCRSLTSTTMPYVEYVVLIEKNTFQGEMVFFLFCHRTIAQKNLEDRFIDYCPLQHIFKGGKKHFTNINRIIFSFKIIQWKISRSSTFFSVYRKRELNKIWAVKTRVYRNRGREKGKQFSNTNLCSLSLEFIYERDIDIFKLLYLSFEVMSAKYHRLDLLIDYLHFDTALMI